jgi:aldose 1-epimerase
MLDCDWSSDVCSSDLENLASTPMPLGLGFHPYFPADIATRLRFMAGSVWIPTEDLLPDRLAKADALGDWSKGASIAGERLIDHCYAQWHGPAMIERGDGPPVVMTAPAAHWLHLYRPPGEGFFCIEPVTHMPDAINRPDGMAKLPPQATQALEMTIAVPLMD